MTSAIPYRIVVFASGLGPGRKYKRYTELVKRDYAYELWTPEQHYQEARLPSAGSFLFPGMHRAREAAMRELAKPQVQQVSIRTNQDRRVYRYFKNADGSVRGYGDGA